MDQKGIRKFANIGRNLALIKSFLSRSINPMGDGNEFDNLHIQQAAKSCVK